MKFIRTSDGALINAACIRELRPPTHQRSGTLARLDDGRSVELAHPDPYAIAKEVAQVIPALPGWRVALATGDGTYEEAEVIAWRFEDGPQPITATGLEDGSDPVAVIMPNGEVVNSSSGTLFASVKEWLEDFERKSRAGEPAT